MPNGFSNISKLAQTGSTLFDAWAGKKVAGYQARLGEQLAGIEARSMERMATREETRGRREYEAEQYKGRVVMSDATAAMAAGGGGVSARQLATLKARADMNAIAALQDATSRAADLRTQAGLTRAEAGAASMAIKSKAQQQFYGAFTTAAQDWTTRISEMQRPDWWPINRPEHTPTKAGQRTQRTR